MVAEKLYGELLANPRLAINRSETGQAQLSRERSRLQGEIAELLPEQQRLRSRLFVARGILQNAQVLIAHT